MGDNMTKFNAQEGVIRTYRDETGRLVEVVRKRYGAVAVTYKRYPERHREVPKNEEKTGARRAARGKALHHVQPQPIAIYSLSHRWEAYPSVVCGLLITPRAIQIY